jgi:hypothetical protein
MTQISHETRRRSILKEMADITRMERGCLSVEHHRNLDGTSRGPYYKHQAWVRGRNVSRRIPLERVDEIEQAIKGYERFRELAEEFVEITVAMTRHGNPRSGREL